MSGRQARRDRPRQRFLVGVSSENGVVRRVSSAILRQFQDESADPLPQTATTNPCFLNPRNSFPGRSIPIHVVEERPKYHRTPVTGCLSKNTMEKKNAVKRPCLRRIHFNHLHLFPSPGDSPSGHRGELSLSLSPSLFTPLSLCLCLLPPSSISPSLSLSLSHFSSPFFFFNFPASLCPPVITALLHRNVFDEFVNEPVRFSVSRFFSILLPLVYLSFLERSASGLCDHEILRACGRKEASRSPAASRKTKIGNKKRKERAVGRRRRVEPAIQSSSQPTRRAAIVRIIFRRAEILCRGWERARGWLVWGGKNREGEKNNISVCSPS